MNSHLNMTRFAFIVTEAGIVGIVLMTIYQITDGFLTTTPLQILSFLILLMGLILSLRWPPKWPMVYNGLKSLCGVLIIQMFASDFGKAWYEVIAFASVFIVVAFATLWLRRFVR